MLSLLNRDGFAILPEVLDAPAIARLRAALDLKVVGGENALTSQRGGNVYAIRNLLSAPGAVRDLARLPAVRALVESTLGADAFAVRGIYFDKIVGANWNVVWHQDLSLAVRARHDLAGWGPWSVKAGIPHVQPPTEVLERMLTVRLHLDDCGIRNGPLRVLPGTHRMGRIGPQEIVALRKRIPERVCSVPEGGALLMRPLLLHASSEAEIPGHRRVLHLEFAADPLPPGLAWNEMV
ncbi:MAG: phytanoyl-CoA dioxygenase family protein [Cytophagales bacterium]|nr:phytanoyl-CoA dioxygenase family protein [Armatimonadota bacterium]